MEIHKKPERAMSKPQESTCPDEEKDLPTKVTMVWQCGHCGVIYNNQSDAYDCHEGEDEKSWLMSDGTIYDDSCFNFDDKEPQESSDDSQGELNNYSVLELIREMISRPVEEMAEAGLEVSNVDEQGFVPLDAMEKALKGHVIIWREHRIKKKEPQESTCQYKKGNLWYDTSCEEEIPLIHFSSKYLYCPYCGRKIEVVGDIDKIPIDEEDLNDARELGG